jgi:hypothetical protein
MKDKILKRLDDVFKVLNELSPQIEPLVKDTNLSKEKQIEVGVKIKALEAALSSFFLLVDILEVDYKMPLKEHSVDMDNYRNQLLKVVDYIKENPNKFNKN